MCGSRMIWLTASLPSSPDPSVIDACKECWVSNLMFQKQRSQKIFSFGGKGTSNKIIQTLLINIYRLQAYDATIALAMAIEKTSTANLGFQMANVSNTSATDLENLRVSQNGPNLVRAFSNTSFIGLTGDFRFINGQLQSLAFQIVNMNENEARRVGFWTPRKGIT